METASYIFIENVNSSFSDKSPFFISDKNSELAIIFRVFSGSCIIKNKNSDESVELSQNYFFEDLRDNEDGDLNFLNDFEENLKLEDYESYISDNKFKNRKFYRSFLNEIAGCVYNEGKEKYTAAFVHLYRAYEHLSYAFPMIYAAKTDNYIGTFESLRKWMTNASSDGNAGELKFLKNFIEALYKDAIEINSTIDVHITAKDELREIIFDGIAKKVVGWESSKKYTSGTIRPDKLSIRFVEFHSFLINLRNRFFHYSNARPDNISLDDIIEAELLFSFVNKPGLNYVANIFHSITKHQM
jgi:hypothetical protein